MLTAGTRIGPYEIAESIGAGGMGIVFRARDQALERDVAIKILPQSLADDAELRQRFAREGRLLAAVNHPHIAQVYGVEDSPAGLAIVMELVPGATLRDLISARSVSGRARLEYARQIALAIDAAHEKGIIHRDLKPDNVKVTPEGTVKVLDFGLAKAWLGDAESSDAATMTGADATRSGHVMGTARYMSPEQARGQPVDRRTDIWSFGCVLFELFSGRPAFDGPSTSDAIAAVLDKDPDWDALAVSTPPRVRHLIARCLEKDRRLRLRDIGDALPELTENSPPFAPSSLTAPVAASPRARWRRALAGLWLVLTVALAATTMWLWQRAAAPAAPAAGLRPVRFALPPPGNARFGSSLPPLETPTIAFSPDGTRLAFIATEKGQPSRVWVRRMEDEEARPVSGTEDAISVFWSPDGGSLAFFASGNLKRVAADGGAAVKIADVPRLVGLSGTWGARGDILFATVQGDDILRVPASGGIPTPAVRRTEGWRRVLWPHFLPDGRRFLYSRFGDKHDGEVVLVEDGGAERPIIDAISLAQFVAPDIVLVVRESTLLAQRIDLASGRPVGDPVSVEGPVGYSAATGWAEMTASPNGMIAMQTHRDVGHVAIFTRSGVLERNVGAPGGYLAVHVAPDESALLFSRLRPELGTYDIWTTTLARGSETPITTSPGMETGEVWLPGMQSIALAVGTGGPPNLFVRDIVSGRERRLLQSPRFQYPTDASPDGKTIAYQQRTTLGTWDVMTVPIDGADAGTPLFASPASETDLRFSPAGGQVAWVSDESGRSEVYVAPFPSNGVRTMVSSGGGFAPRWRRDGRELYFMSPSGTLMASPVSASGQPGNAVRLFAAGNWTGYDVMAGGERFVAIVGDARSAEQPLTVLLNWQQVIGRGR